MALEFNLNEISDDISDWPEGVYFARVAKAEMSISRSGNPMLVVDFELWDERRGSGRVRDWILSNNDFGLRKGKKLILAINDVSPEEEAAFIADNQNVQLSPQYLMQDGGAELLVNMVKRPGRNKDGTPSDRMFANVGGIFYAPVSQADELLAKH